jgi:hypothetical protein
MVLERLYSGDALGIVWNYYQFYGVDILIFFFVLYLYVAFALMALANKHEITPNWFAFFPILNVILIARIAGRSPWWAALYLLPVLSPTIGIVFFSFLIVFLFSSILENMEYSPWLSLLMLIPIVNLIALGVFAYGKK